jgi:hypothetical protein
VKFLKIGDFEKHEFPYSPIHIFTCIKKVPLAEDFNFIQEILETYFFFLAAFFLGAAFFFAAFFLVAILLEFNVSKNGLTIVKITIILYYPNFFSTKF